MHMWLAGRPSRPGALLTPDAMDVRSPTDGVMRTPLPLTPLPLTSPSLPSVNPMRCGCYAIVACSFITKQAAGNHPYCNAQYHGTCAGRRAAMQSQHGTVIQESRRWRMMGMICTVCLWLCTSTRACGCVQGSATLHILRTPLPFGSPVPYPHTGNTPGSRDKAPAGAQRGGSTAQEKHRGIPCLPYTLPYELRCFTHARAAEAWGILRVSGYRAPSI